MRPELIQLTHALQLAAFLPCVAIIIFLIARRHNTRLSILPALYFASLAGHFLTPLHVFGGIDVSVVAPVLQNLLPEFTFLLLVQFMLGRIPPPVYWLVLSIPLIGGTPLLALTYIGDDACIDYDTCVSTSVLITLYRVMGGALAFLLLVSFLRRHRTATTQSRRSQYWLIISMICFTLLLLTLDLVDLASSVREDRILFIRTMVGIAFVYVALSSTFRVFHPSYVKQLMKPGLSALETDAMKRIEHLFTNVHAYRDSELNRAGLAKLVKLPEHLLSRAVNLYFGKSVTDLINEWRLKEVKSELEATGKPISDIAFDAGFSSIASFNRVFKADTGMSATAYRRAGKTIGNG